MKNFILEAITAGAIVTWIFTGCALATESSIYYVAPFVLSTTWLTLFGIANRGLDDV